MWRFFHEVARLIVTYTWPSTNTVSSMLTVMWGRVTPCNLCTVRVKAFWSENYCLDAPFPLISKQVVSFFDYDLVDGCEKASCIERNYDKSILLFYLKKLNCITFYTQIFFFFILFIHSVQSSELSFLVEMQKLNFPQHINIIF